MLSSQKLPWSSLTCILQVENPVAFATGWTKLLSLWHLHAQYAGLMVAPIHMCADWSYRCVPLVQHFSDPRNLTSLLTYGWVLWGVLAGRPWEIVAEMLGYGRVSTVSMQLCSALVLQKGCCKTTRCCTKASRCRCWQRTISGCCMQAACKAATNEFADALRLQGSVWDLRCGEAARLPCACSETLGYMFSTGHESFGLAGEYGELGGCGVCQWRDEWDGCGCPCDDQEGAESGACQGTLEVICGCWAHHCALPARIKPLLLGKSRVQCQSSSPPITASSHWFGRLICRVMRQ